MSEVVTDKPGPDLASAIPLESFTDEELAILAGTDGIVVAPFLNRISEGQLATAQRTAYRGLLGRGIVDPPTEQVVAAAGPGEITDGEAGAARHGVEVAVRADVHAMVRLRATAHVVVAVARTISSRRDFWYAHVADDACLLEEVSTDGFHRFAMLDTADLPQAVVDAVVHPESGDGVGDPVEFTPSTDHPAPPAILARLGEAPVHCEVVIRAVGEDGVVMLGAFSGPRGAWLFRNDYGSGDAVVARPCAATDLRERLRAATVGALERVRDLETGRPT